MGSHMAKPSNKSMVDKLVEQNSYIRSPLVEGAFRAVDRAMYFDLEEGDGVDPYEDDPWRRGNLHLSAPCIYAKVVEALDLRSGLSFLNLGSGTGYLNTIVGLLVGPNGLNHGVELHADVVEYAYNRLRQFKQHSYAIDKYNFSEPVFFEGNCSNLNPNSQYDRIYLGAACLPDLENFMKKLIKPNGGILVMPYENHLIRYIRIAESEWRSEKLMDVNFTLMIRQGDNESMIDMPLAEAKSLKELCRINIRQRLRDKTNSLNPHLMHSDNISSRRMRKAKAKRREERRSKFNKDQYFFGDRRDSRNSNKSQPKKSRHKGNGDGSNSSRSGCRCCRYVQEMDELNMMPSSGESSKPSTSSASVQTRVMTRSASRRLEGLSAKPSLTPTGTMASQPEQSNSSRDISPSKYHLTTSSLESSDSDDDHHDNNNKRTTSSNNSGTKNTTNINSTGQDGNNCARTRPFLCPPLYMPSANRIAASDRLIDGRPLALLPFHRRMARIINPPSSSSSSSESSDSNELDDEYDYPIARRVVLDWPGFLRIHDDDPANLDFPDDVSQSTDSTLSSNNADLILEDDRLSEISSWDSIYDSFHPDLGELSSFLDSDGTNHENGDEDDDDTNYQDNVEFEAIGRASSSISTNASPLQPSTSGCQTRASKLNDVCSGRKSVSTTRSTIGNVASTMADEKAGSDQEPVARRLRSKRVSKFNTEIDNPDGTSETQSPINLDRPMPSCSRNELQRDNNWHKSDPKLLKSRLDRLRLLRHSEGFECRNNRSDGKSRVSGQDDINPSPSSSRIHPNATQGNHSNAMRPSPESSVDLRGLDQRQGLFTRGRVLIATAFGTTLSLAAHRYHRHHHVPSASRSGSLRLFEHHCRPAQQLDRKRKRHSNSESSDTSESSSSNRQTQRSGSQMRRRCECSKPVQQPNLSSTATPQMRGANLDSDANMTPISSNTELRIDQHMPGANYRDQGQANAIDPSEAQAGFILANRRDPVAASRTTLAAGIGQIDNNNTGIDRHCRRHQQNRCNHQLCDHHRQHRHHHHDSCQRSPRTINKRTREIDQNNSSKGEKKQRGQRKRDKRRENECQRYHNHLSGYIRRLPLPRVLHSYLNYERNLCD